MSKKARKRPTETSWDSDDDLLREDTAGFSTFSKAKGEDEDIDEDALLGISGDKSSVVYEIEGNEDIGEGDLFQILDPDVSAFDESTDLGLGSNQADQEVLDYEDTVQEEQMEGTEDSQLNNMRTEVKTEIIPVQAPAFSTKVFKETKREESDSDEDKGDHRERFKSERKMITLKSSKYSKPIPETLEVTPEMQEEINKFEKKAPVKQRLGQKTGNQNRQQNQRQNQGPRLPGNQNIRGGPRGNQRQQKFAQRTRMPQQGQFGPRTMGQQQRGQRPRFPHEMNLVPGQGPAGNQMRQPSPGVRPQAQESLLGPGPQMMPEQRPLLETPVRPNVHLNPQFRGLIPMPEPFTSQPQPFNQGQPFHPPPHSQPNNFPRQAWPPQQPGPTPQGYPPQQASQPRFQGPQPPYPPASMNFNPRPGHPQPLIPSSTGPQPQQLNFVPQHPAVSAGQNFRLPFPHPQGGPPVPGQHSHGGPPGPGLHQGGPPGSGPQPQGPNFQSQRFGAPEPRPGFHQGPPDLHIQFRPMGPEGHRPPNPVIQVEQVRPQLGQQVGNIRPQIREVNINAPGRQIRPQVGLKRPHGVVSNYRGKLTGVGRGQFKQLKQQQIENRRVQAERLGAARQFALKKKGFNPSAKDMLENPSNRNMLSQMEGQSITVVSSRGVKRSSTETPNVVPVKQVKSEGVPMEPVDPELQRALEEQKRQREAIKAKKEQNRLAIASKRRQELEEKLAKQGLTLEEYHRLQAGEGNNQDMSAPQGQGQTMEQQGQKISVLGTQYASTNVSQSNPKLTNIVQVQTADVGRGQNIPARGSGRGLQGQARGVVRGQRGGRIMRGRGLARGQNVGAPGQQVNVGHQQAQQSQPAPSKQGPPAKVQKKQAAQNLGQGQGVKPLTIVRRDSKGGVLQTYNATPSQDKHGKTVFKLKIQDHVQTRTVQATSPPSNRTVVAAAGRGNQGHTERQVVAHSNLSEQQSARTVIASGIPRTISFGSNPHLRSRKVCLEGLNSTTQEAKLLSMVKSVGASCEEIKILPNQRRAILTFQNIEMATKFVKKYNRSMVDLTHIQVKEIPE